MIKDTFNLLEHIKPDNPYVPVTTEDAKTIEKEKEKRRPKILQKQLLILIKLT